jgi:hypothetical protein
MTDTPFDAPKWAAALLDKLAYVMAPDEVRAEVGDYIEGFSARMHAYAVSHPEIYPPHDEGDDE